MKISHNLITITLSFLIVTMSFSLAHAAGLTLPKPDSLAGPTADQQASTNATSSTTGGYGVSFVIPFVTQLFVGSAGTFALLSFVYGGFLYVSSFGDEGQTEKAKKIMMWAAIGLALAMLSYAIVSVLLKLKIGTKL